MERLTKRVDRLEQDTHQIKTDLAVLTERSQNFATKADVEGLRTDQFKLRCEMLEGFARIEKQTAEQFARHEKQTAGQFARIDAKFARIDEWTKRADENFVAIDDKFKRIDERFDRLNERMTWTLLVPAVLAVLGWLAREFWLKM